MIYLQSFEYKTLISVYISKQVILLPEIIDSNDNIMSTNCTTYK